MIFFIVKVNEFQLADEKAYGLFRMRTAKFNGEKALYENAYLVAGYTTDSKEIFERVRILDNVLVDPKNNTEYFFEADSLKEGVEKFQKIMKTGIENCRYKEFQRVMLTHDELTGMLVWLDDSEKGCNAMGYYVTFQDEDKGGLITERLIKFNLKPEDYKYAGKIYKIEV
mgnify:CR=1 FL=1